VLRQFCAGIWEVEVAQLELANRTQAQVSFQDVGVWLSQPACTEPEQQLVREAFMKCLYPLGLSPLWE
jgi:hypothetical protein